MRFARDPPQRATGCRCGRCVKRLLGLCLSVVTFGIGFLGIVFRENRRGWEDRFSGADVVYDERRPEPAPWSRAGAVPSESAAFQPARSSQRCTSRVALPETISRATLTASTTSGAERFVDAAGADRDAEVGRGRDRRHRDRDADRGAGAGLEGEHRRDRRRRAATSTVE